MEHTHNATQIKRGKGIKGKGEKQAKRYGKQTGKHY